MRAKWDMKGELGIRDANASISGVMIDTRIETEASPEKPAELLRLTHKRCPMAATIAKAVSVRRKLFVKGEETPV